MNEDDKAMLVAAMEAGVPWWMAREAVASTRLDRDQTHSLEGQGVGDHDGQDQHPPADDD